MQTKLTFGEFFNDGGAAAESIKECYFDGQDVDESSEEFFDAMTDYYQIYSDEWGSEFSDAVYNEPTFRGHKFCLYETLNSWRRPRSGVVDEVFDSPEDAWNFLKQHYDDVGMEFFGDDIAFYGLHHDGCDYYIVRMLSGHIQDVGSLENQVDKGRLIGAFTKPIGYFFRD